MYFVKLDKQITDFLFKGQEDSYANFKIFSWSSGPEMFSWNMHTNQKDKTDILEIKELRTKVFTRKLHMQTVSYGQQYFYAVYFLWGSLTKRLPEPVWVQWKWFKYDGKQRNFYMVCIWKLFTEVGLSRCISVESNVENRNIDQNGSIK